MDLSPAQVVYVEVNLILLKNFIALCQKMDYNVPDKCWIISNYLLSEVTVVLLQFSVLPASKCSKKDVIAALDIYCKTVDPGSLTDTNQIKDYIWNSKNHCNETRSMFFYILYDQNSNVIGFAEYAYLPHNQVLVLDYLCLIQILKLTLMVI